MAIQQQTGILGKVRSSFDGGDASVSSLQSQLAQVQPTQDIRAVGQKAGAQVTAGQQQERLAGQQQAQDVSNMTSSLGLSGRARDIQGRILDIGRERDQKSADLENQLSNINADAKRRVFDEQMRIRKDKNNQSLLTERQLLDYAIANSKDEQSYLDWAQRAQTISRREVQMWDMASKKLEQALTQVHLTGERELNQEQTQRLLAQKMEAERQRKKAAARARNRMAAWQAGGAIIGGAAGAPGGAAGVAAGTQGGAALGTFAATTTE